MKDFLKVVGAFLLILTTVGLLGLYLCVLYHLGILLPIGLWQAGYQGWAIVQVLVMSSWFFNRGGGNN